MTQILPSGFTAPHPSNRTAYILLDDGTSPIRFDVVTQETHTLVNDITEHPVESGANVTDHVRSQLDTIALEVFVSNAPISPFDRFSFGDVGSVKSLPFVGAGLDVDDPRLANSSASTLQFDSATDNVSETYRALREAKENATLVTVVTPLWDYQSMVIKSVSIPRTAAEGDGAKMTVEFKQIRLVETKLVAEPLPTETRGTTAVDKGAKGATSPTGGTGATGPKQSLLAAATDAVSGLFK